jgi:hypothetical protein
MEKLKSYITWPIVAVVAVVAASMVAIVLLAPPDVREWLIGANGIVAAIITYYMRSPREPESRLDRMSRLDRTLERTEPASRRADELIAQHDETWPKGRDRSREGCARAPALAVVVGIVVAFALVGALLTGCGGGAVRVHAESAAIATVAASGAQDVYLRALDQRMGACEPGSAGAGCVYRTRLEMRDAEAGVESLRVLAATYRDAVRVAILAGSDDVASTLFVAASRLITRWADVARIFRLYDLDLPTLTLPAVPR